MLQVAIDHSIGFTSMSLETGQIALTTLTGGSAAAPSGAQVCPLIHPLQCGVLGMHMAVGQRSCAPLQCCRPGGMHALLLEGCTRQDDSSVFRQLCPPVPPEVVHGMFADIYSFRCLSLLPQAAAAGGPDTSGLRRKMLQRASAKDRTSGLEM